MADHSTTERRSHVLDARLSATSYTELIDRANRWALSRSEAADAVIHAGCAFLSMLDETGRGTDLVGALNDCAVYLGTPPAIERRSGQDRRRVQPAPRQLDPSDPMWHYRRVQVAACACCSTRLFDHLPPSTAPGAPVLCDWCSEHCHDHHVRRAVMVMDPPPGCTQWMVQDGTGHRVAELDDCDTAARLAGDYRGTAWCWGVILDQDDDLSASDPARPAEWQLIVDERERGE